MQREELTQGELKRLLAYSEVTGMFSWRTASGNRKAGSSAGGVALGYLAIGLRGRKYQAHRLAWLYVYGAWPGGEVDHINRDKLDNRISNLRLATRAQNGANCSLSKRNTSGAKGVTWVTREGKWQAQIAVGRRHKHLGYFDSVEAAAMAYDAAATAAFKDFASLNAEVVRGR